MMKWNLILPAIDEIPIIRGAGVPSGTPPFNGARYLDTTTGVVYLGRNVLNFGVGTFISIPEVSARTVILKAWHNDPNPPSSRVIYGHSASPADPRSLSRAVTTGFVIATGSPLSSLVIDGVSVSNNSTTMPTAVWSNLVDVRSSDGTFDTISRNAGSRYLGRLADFQILGAGDALLRSYSIDEGSGTAIIDSVSGQNGTLTLGSGSWELTWVPQN